MTMFSTDSLVNIWNRFKFHAITVTATAVFILSICVAYQTGRLNQRDMDYKVILHLAHQLDEKLQFSYEQSARLIARKHRMEEELVLAVMWQESRFNPDCVSPVGAYGLMQLMPGTARELGLPKRHTWMANIDAGVRYLKWLMDKTDRLEHLLIAYNWGIGNLGKYKRGEAKSLPNETRNYIARVKQHMKTRPWTRAKS